MHTFLYLRNAEVTFPPATAIPEPLRALISESGLPLTTALALTLETAVVPLTTLADERSRDTPSTLTEALRLAVVLRLLRSRGVTDEADAALLRPSVTG